MMMAPPPPPPPPLLLLPKRRPGNNICAPRARRWLAALAPPVATWRQRLRRPVWPTSTIRAFEHSSPGGRNSKHWRRRQRQQRQQQPEQTITALSLSLSRSGVFGWRAKAGRLLLWAGQSAFGGHWRPNAGSASICHLQLAGWLWAGVRAGSSEGAWRQSWPLVSQAVSLSQLIIVREKQQRQ